MTVISAVSKHAIGNTDLGDKAPHPVFTNLSANSAGDIYINGKLFDGQRDYINFQHDGKQKQRKKWEVSRVNLVVFAHGVVLLFRFSLHR